MGNVGESYTAKMRMTLSLPIGKLTSFPVQRHVNQQSHRHEPLELPAIVVLVPREKHSSRGSFFPDKRSVLVYIPRCGGMVTRLKGWDAFWKETVAGPEDVGCENKCVGPIRK